MTHAEHRLNAHVLFQLSLTCSFFCIALRPGRFRWLVLGGANSHGNAFYEALVHGDAHAQAMAAHIRKCTISRGWSRWNPTEGVAAMPKFTITWRALCWASNIESFELSHIFITKQLWNFVGRLSNLKALSMSSTSFEDDIPAEGIAGLPVRLSLSIPASQVFSWPRFLNTIVLSMLECSFESLETLVAGGPINTLETLKLEHSSVTTWSMMEILPKVPSVCSLTIWLDIIDGPSAPPQAFATLLPHLHSLTCPFPLAVLLAPGKPITKLHLLDDDSPPLDLGTILGSHVSYTITDLDIPSTISLIAGHFPNLRNLVVGLPIQPADFDQLSDPEFMATTVVSMLIFVCGTCVRWPVQHSVQELRLEVGSPLLDLEVQHMVLTYLSRKFPALRWFQLSDPVEWERFAVDEPWQVLIPAGDQASVVASFDAGEPGVVDHGGYLQRLSTDARRNLA